MGSRPSSLRLIVWRISNYADVSGRGGLVVSGRWHTRPTLVMYCSEEPHTAYCEAIKQVGSELLLPDSYSVLEIEGPARSKIEALDRASLPSDWSADSAEALSACREIGDAWLKACRTPLLRVPSAARPGFDNFLLNPVHRDADDFEIIRVVPQPFPDWVRRPGVAES